MEYKSIFKAKEIDTLLKSGVPIVDSVDKLDALDLQVGSLASVAFDNVIEKSFRDLYQPTIDDVDMSTFTVNTDNMSSVKSVTVTPNASMLSSLAEPITMTLIPRAKSDLTEMLLIGILAEGIQVIISTSSGHDQKTIMSIDNGVAQVNEEELNAINELLSSDDYCFLGDFNDLLITPEEYDIIDSVIKVKAGSSACDLYIKDVKGFRPFKEGATYVSSLLNDIGYITSKSVFKNIEVHTDETPIKFKKNTMIINMTDTFPQSDAVDEIQDLNEICSLGYFGRLYIKTLGLYVKWATPAPNEDSDNSGLFLFTYTGFGNVFIGEYYAMSKRDRTIGIYYHPTKPTTIQLMNCNPLACGIMHLSTESVNIMNYDLKPTQSYDWKYSTDLYAEFLINRIPSGAFSSNPLITEVKLFGITYVDYVAFANCENLRKVGLHNHLPIKTEREAFSNTNIDTIEISYYQAFCHSEFHDSILSPATSNRLLLYGAEHTELQLNHYDIEYIGTNVFANCNRIVSFIMPKSLVRIKDRAFLGCTSVKKYDFSLLEKVVILESASAFNGMPDSCKIIVPDTLYDEWIATVDWKSLADHIIKASEYTES